MQESKRDKIGGEKKKKMYNYKKLLFTQNRKY